ncbi:MAG: sulfide/dihydroorotate dehydrogenase-like FAD/NAD-binding protein [Armatimonadota bacterium]|nr:sulfide/dihydroorotate dehydrogenase-like FAD/NAD-binding protein [Armatimonadota bacterium]
MNENEYPGACKLADLNPDELRNTIVRKQKLSPILTRMEIRAPLIAQAVKAGQFVMVWVGEKSERVPLTICDWNPEEGTITIIFQEVGFSTKELGQLEEGENIESIAGPLGKPTEIDNFGTAVVVGGGVGTAIAYPVAKALKKAGNELITIVGAREKSLILLEDEMKSISDELIITTDDGSYGRKGLVTDALKELLESRKIDYVFAAGPLPMMRAVARTTEPYKVKTIVSLDPIMIDGTGMCGGCRVTVGGKTMFTCVDGPDFDAHQVDWDELRARKAYYFDEENKARPNNAAVHIPEPNNDRP